MQTRCLLVFCLATISSICLAQTPSDYRAGSLVKQEPQPIYAADPHDPRMIRTGSTSQNGR